MEPRCEGFPTRSDTNQAVQPWKMARGLKFRNHVEQSSFIQIVDMNRFFTGTCERLVNRLSEKVVKSRILPKIQVCSENKNKHKI